MIPVLRASVYVLVCVCLHLRKGKRVCRWDRENNLKVIVTMRSCK